MSSFHKLKMNIFDCRDGQEHHVEELSNRMRSLRSEVRDLRKDVRVLQELLQ
jgi:hypothetical protein